MKLRPPDTHLESEEEFSTNCSLSDQIEVDTFDGKLFVGWDPHAAVTPLGQLPFFIEFLKLGSRFKP